MGKSEKRNRRLNLCVSTSLVDRFEQEFRFQCLHSRLQLSTEVDTQSKANFLRSIVNPYCQRYLDGVIYESVDLGESPATIPFYLDRQSEGLWNVAIKAGAAMSYNGLVETALWWYFDRADERIRTLRDRLMLYQEALKTADPRELALLP